MEFGLKNKIIILLYFVYNVLIAQSWTQIGNDIDGEAFGDRSGYAVSLSSDDKSVILQTLPDTLG